MKIFALTAAIIVCTACKTSSPGQLSSTEGSASSKLLPAEAQALWDSYVQEETTQAKLQADCAPIQILPEGEVKGLFVMYHGFSGCPIQFINVGRKLAAMGYHVLLPLLPGQGRIPLRIDRVAMTVTDDNSGIPRNAQPYRDLSQKINRIATATPGYRVVAGLSGGGGQATGTASAGYDPNTGKNIWNRALMMAPLYEVPGIQGDLADFVNLSVPSFKAGFGSGCEQGQLDEKEPRHGICDFEVVHVQSMETYGRESAAQASNLKIPVQIVGVEGDTAADNKPIYEYYKKLASTDKSLCYYARGVPHAMLYEGDYLHPDTRPWVGDVEAMMVAWVTEGKHADTDGVSVEYGQPRCKLTASLPKVP